MVSSHDEVQRLKEEVQAEVDRLGSDLLSVSRFLHANPELAYEERQAAELLTDILEQHGFVVTREAANLPTAFTGLAGSGAPRPARRRAAPNRTWRRAGRRRTARRCHGRPKP